MPRLVQFSCVRQVLQIGRCIRVFSSRWMMNEAAEGRREWALA
jgi:hypothetical protein